jgi:phospholipid/cholesterol/gamma-HCH transport system substrate-binding protein
MTNEQKVGLFFLVGIILVFVAIEATVGTQLLTTTYNLYVKYNDVEGLRTGDPVQVAGLKLGKVDGISLQPNGVLVKLQLDQQAVVRRDSVARLDYRALSGNRFISISLGTPNSPVLKNGDTVEGEVPPSLTDMITKFKEVAQDVTNLADSLNQNQDRLLNNVNTMIEENRNALQQTLANVDSITAKLDRGDGTLAKLLNDGSLYDHANAMVADLQRISDRLARGQGDLGRLVNSDGALYDDVRETVARLNVTVSNLEEISGQVRDGQGTLGRLVQDDQLYQDAQSTLHNVDRAATGIEDQSPISVLGTLVTTLF